jgi:8-oxo-dGTP diphosphatase
MYSHPRITQRRSIWISTNCSRERLLLFSVFLNAVLLLVVLLLSRREINAFGASTRYRVEELVFHGGHPEHAMKGSCVCTTDNYCMCNPALAIDLVIVTSDQDHVLLVRRKDTDQLATMGGFVQVGESVEEAIHRELREEMGLTLTSSPVLLGIYSDTRRDNRRHTASAAFVVQLDLDQQPPAVAADDVKEIVRLPIDRIESTTFFSDHKTIITDYLIGLHDTNGKRTVFNKPVQDNFADVKRSLCPLVGSSSKDR